jgi:hypothetical protein
MTFKLLYGNAMRTKKTLMTPAEKAHIIASMKALGYPKSVMAWVVEFKRLPATIRKLAAEAQVELRED